MATSFPEKDKCPKPCAGIGAFKKAPKTPEQVKDEVKDAEFKAAEVEKTTPSVHPESQMLPQSVVSGGSTKEEYLPQLSPGPDGKVDWTPLADLTGTRPAVNKYAISRYSLDEWKNHNNLVLSKELLNEANAIDYNAKSAMMQAFGNMDKKQTESNQKLQQKIKDVFRWKTEVERTVKALTDEVEKLEVERQRLKGATRVLMLPEAISQECLDLRSNRFDFDLVSDMAEQALIREKSLVGEVRDTLKKTLEQLEEQMAKNKAAKLRIEADWCDKQMAYDTDTLNLSLNSKSNTILFRPGAVKYGEYSAPLEYWEYFCRDTLMNCEAERQRSEDLRGTLNSILVNGGRKLRTMADKTDVAFAETVAQTTELCTKLEETLKETLQKLADVENLIDNLRDAVRKMDATMKVAQTRLENRNISRPRGENVRDTPHEGLIDEAKKIHETVTMLLGQIRNSERVRSELMDRRRLLERDIASKRKTLNIDRDRIGMIRSHYPSASELAGF